MKKTKEKKLTYKEWEMEHITDQLYSEMFSKIYLFSPLGSIDIDDRRLISLKALGRIILHIMTKNLTSRNEAKCLSHLDEYTNTLKSNLRQFLKERKGEKVIKK